MDYSCDEVRGQLEQLKAFSYRLGESMGRTAEGLRANGASPTAELIAELQNYRERFQNLQLWLASQPGTSTSDAAPSSPESLEDLQRELESKFVARRAFEFLEQLQTLTHADGDQHPTLAICEQARRAAIDALHGPESISKSTCRAIIDGVHPLNALWNLLQEQDRLTDEEWTQALDQVAQHLGRDVATSVARHKLGIPAPILQTSSLPVFAQ